MAKRRANGGDLWASKDGKLYVGHPFSTIGALGILHELGVPKSGKVAASAVKRFLEAIRDDGRIKLGPSSPLYPCYTAEAARMLCRYGKARDARVKRAVAHLLANAHPEGGWRCNFTRFGNGPETRFANPGATLFVLDALRFYKERTKGDTTVNAAVASLLDHWDIGKPMGPCHYGIGTTFMQVEYPFLRYNLFYYVYVLSFYAKARRDRRFKQALRALQAKLDDRGRVVVERPHRALSKLAFCTKGAASKPATKRYREILGNLET